MKIYPSLIFPAVILTATVRAEPDEAYSPTRVCFVESIPTFDLKDATFEEAVAALEEKWKNQFPKLACPIASIRREREEGPRGTSTAAITLSLRNVTYREAFGYIAAVSGRRVIDIRDRSVAEEIAWIEEDWRTCAIKISKPVLEFFNLSKRFSRSDPRASDSPRWR